MGLFNRIKDDLLMFIARCNGNGVIEEDFETREIKLEKFTSLLVSGPWCVDFYQTTGEVFCRIIIEKRFLDRVDVGLVGDELHFGLLEVIGFGPKIIPRVELYLPELPEKFTLSGQSELIMTEKIAGENLTLELSGESSAEINDIELKKLTLTMKNASKFGGNGRVDNFVLNSSGHTKGEFDGECKLFSGSMRGNSEFEITHCQQADLLLTEGAKLRLAVEEKLTVNAQGVSRIKYSGNPEIVKNIAESAKLLHMSKERHKKFD